MSVIPNREVPDGASHFNPISKEWKDIFDPPEETIPPAKKAKNSAIVSKKTADKKKQRNLNLPFEASLRRDKRRQRRRPNHETFDASCKRTMELLMKLNCNCSMLMFTYLLLSTSRAGTR